MVCRDQSEEDRGEAFPPSAPVNSVNYTLTPSDLTPTTTSPQVPHVLKKVYEHEDKKKKNVEEKRRKIYGASQEKVSVGHAGIRMS